MRKIDEILDEYDINNENITVEEEAMAKDEIERIKKLTLSKANLSRKRKSRKLILPLAAAMILILSFAAVFAQGGLSHIFHGIFGDNIKYVNDMGTEINKSYSQNGITVNVANMLGDENSFYIVVELIKENGESFKDTDYIYFQDFNLGFDSSGGYTWYKIEDDDENDNKATIMIVGDITNKAAGRKMTLNLKDMIEYNTKDSDYFNPYIILSNTKELINQVLVDNTDHKEQINGKMSEREKKKIEYMNSLIPLKILPYKYLNIPMIEGNENVYVDNIGFVEGKLCMRIAMTDYEQSSIGEIYFTCNEGEEKKYGEYTYTKEQNGIKYDYYSFDIKNLEELSSFKFKYNIVNRLKKTEGEWNITFKADYKNTTRTINVNKNVEIKGKKYNISNIKLSPISVNVKMTKNIFQSDSPEDSAGLTDMVKVVMKDGTIANVRNTGSNISSFKVTLNCIFDKPLDITQIQSVKIGSTEIEIK